MKKTFKKLMAVILAVMVMLGCSAMAFAGGDGMEVEESIPSAIDSMYNSGEDFIYIFTSPDCANSAAVMKYYVNWVRIVDVALYEVSTEDGYPSTMCADIGNSVTLPVVVFVKDGKAEYYQGTATRTQIETALLAYCGIDASIPKSASFSKSEYTIKVGEIIDIPYTISDADAYSDAFAYGSDRSIARLRAYGNGKIRVEGLKVGTATFSLETTIGGKIATVTVNVVDENATTYTLTYNANGGNGAPSAQSGAASYTVSSVKPVRSGYTFLGWSKSSSATSASYVAGNTITLSANTTLYAVWQKNNTTPFKAVCPNCEEVFTDEVQYSEHAKTCQIITCEKCGEKITVGSAYEEHMASCGNNEESGGILESIWSFIQAIINFILLPIRIFF